MANYAIMRIEKRKLGAVGRMCNHHERLKAEYKSNPDIDPSRTHLNYHIVEPTAKYRKAVLDRIEEVGAKRRKDSVVMQDCFVGGTPDWLKGKSVEEQREYFDYAYRFFENNFKKENIISAVVHLDEATPHMHLCFVPITEKGRLSSKDIIGGPKGLVGWQDKFYEYMHEKYPDITRGTPAKVSHRKHIPPFMFKVAGELYDHYGEICGAINDIGLVNNAKKKDAAIALLGRYAPEMRSRGVSVSIILQNLAQLKALFEKQWESIVGNCDTFLYLGGNEQSTHKYVSELLGKETIDTNTYGKSEGRSGSYSTNYQISGRELMTPDEVRMLDNRYALLFIRGERPVMDFKYDIMKHPNVRLTTDGGKPPYIHGEPTQAVATLVFDSDIPKNAVSVKAVSTSYELLSNEDLEEIFNI